jgi:hypothetical protein
MVEIKIEEIPETWDTIKHIKPIYPTCSQQKFGGVSYNNDKYRCYSVKHSKPTYNLMPYQPEGFGYGERAMKYVPLSHVQNNIRPASSLTKRLRDKSFMRQVYENSIDAIKKKQGRLIEESQTTSSRRQDRLRDKFRYELGNLKNKTDEFIGDTKYRIFKINRTIQSREL